MQVIQPENKLGNQRLCRVVTLSGIVLSVVTALLFILRAFYSCPGYEDESYQAMCVARWEQAPLGMFLFWKAHLWTTVFGDSYISLRLFNSIIILATLVLSTWYFYYRTHSKVYAYWMFVLSGSLGLIETNIMYGWDSGPMMLYTIAAIVSIEYFYTRKRLLLCVLASLVCILGLSRVSLIILLPVCLIAVSFVKNLRPRNVSGLNSALMFVMCYASTFLIVTTLMIGSPGNYIDAFVPNNIISGHSIREVIAVSFYSFGEATARQFVGLISLCLAVWVLKGQYTIKKLVLMTVMAFVLGLIELIVSYDAKGVETGYGAVGFTLFAGVIAMPLVWRIANGQKCFKVGMLIGILSLWLLAPSLGSDNMFIRCNACGLLGVGIGAIYRFMTARQLLWVKTVFICAIVAYGTTAVVRIFCMAADMTETLADYPKMQSIHMTKANKKDINEVFGIVKRLETLGVSDRVNFDGRRYLFGYTLQKSPIYDLHIFHHSKTRSDEIARREIVLNHYDGWLFFKVTMEEISGIDSMLISNEFVCVENSIKKTCKDSSYIDNEGRGLILFVRQQYADNYIKLKE